MLVIASSLYHVVRWFISSKILPLSYVKGNFKSGRDASADEEMGITAVVVVVVVVFELFIVHVRLADLYTLLCRPM